MVCFYCKEFTHQIRSELLDAKDESVVIQLYNTHPYLTHIVGLIRQGMRNENNWDFNSNFYHSASWTDGTRNYTSTYDLQLYNFRRTRGRPNKGPLPEDAWNIPSLRGFKR